MANKGGTGKVHFNLLATNGQVIATSEPYESKAAALKGIESVKNAPKRRSKTPRADGQDRRPRCGPAAPMPRVGTCFSPVVGAASGIGRHRATGFTTRWCEGRAARLDD
jgi:uncharacterized protein YegP (UPF0339 family)